MINRVYKFSKFSVGEVYGITSSFVPGGLNDVCLNWNTVFRSKYDLMTTLLSKIQNIGSVEELLLLFLFQLFLASKQNYATFYNTSQHCVEQNVKYCAAARVFLAVVVGSFLRRGYCCNLQTYCCQKQLRSNWLVLQRFDLCHLDLMAMVIATV